MILILEVTLCSSNKTSEAISTPRVAHSSHTQPYIRFRHSQHPPLTLYRIPSRVQLAWLPSSIESAIRKHTNCLRRALSWCDPANIVSTALHKGDSRIIIGIFEGDLIWDQLIVQTRLCQSFRRCHPLVDDVNDVLDSCGDDTASSCGASDQKQ